MRQRIALRGLAIPSLMLAAACSQSPQSPVSPSVAASSTAANPDGSTLKVTAPTLVSPVNGDRVDSTRPTFVFNNATGRFTTVAPGYRIQFADAAGNVVAERIVEQGSGSQTSFEADADVAYDADYSWRVRAELSGQPGPWSSTAAFKGPAAPVAGGAFTGSVGSPRDIGVNEAADIVFRIYQAGRFNISGGSSRAQMNLYLEMAVAAIHYGHVKWNPAGPDNDWCIKNGGPGRPQSDDIIVSCSTREAWDLVSGIGGPNAYWVTSWVGRLDSAQAIYPPNPSTLSLLPQ
jgi:hypothetical protein